MKMTAGEIIEEARSLWNEPSADFITADEALRWVNMAQADFCRQTKALRYFWQLSTTEDTQEYAWNLDARLMELLWITVEGIPLGPTTRAELDSYDENWRQSAGGPTGQPYYYYITDVHDQQLGFFPCPDDTYVANVYYVEDPPEITSTDGYPKIRETYHDCLVSWVAWRGHRKNRDWEAATEAKKDYLFFVREAKTQIDKKTPEKRRIMSGPDYRGYPRKAGLRLPEHYGWVGK